jgi:hypothetical protein
MIVNFINIKTNKKHIIWNMITSNMEPCPPKTVKSVFRKKARQTDKTEQVEATVTNYFVVGITHFPIL